MIKFCHTCGEDVETYIVDRMGTKELTCINCGMTLAVEKPTEPKPEPPKPVEAARPPEPVIPVIPVVPPKPVEPPKPPEAPKPVKKFKPLELVVVADESPVVLKLIKDALFNNALAKDVAVCVDGAEFISTFMRTIKNERVPSLVILAISMPNLNGLNTCTAMRAMEKGAHLQPSTPVIFLTASTPDEKFEKVISNSRPAEYIYKGTNPNPEQFELMVVEMVKKLFPNNYEYVMPG